MLILPPDKASSMNLRSILPNRDPITNWQLLTTNGEMDSKLFHGFPLKTKKASRPFFLSNITTTNEDQLLLENLNQTWIDWGTEPNTFVSLFLHGKACGHSSWSTMLTKAIKTWSLPIERLIWASFFVNSLNSMLGLLEWPKSWMEKRYIEEAHSRIKWKKLENRNIRLYD